MKKTAKRLGMAVLTPMLLFILLAILIYLPPIQNWAVRTVTSIVAQKTGMEISVEHVSLEFPLDLGLDGFRAIQPNDSLPLQKDTIADVKKLIASVRLLPLLKSRVVIDELSLHQARINTVGLISDVCIKADLSELWLSSRGIDLDQELVEVNGARLKDARIDIALSDTAAVDTTESTAKWIINGDSLSISKTDFTLHMPGDSLRIHAYLGRAVAQKPLIDIGTGTYQIHHLTWHDGTFHYDDRSTETMKGFDYNHIALRQIQTAIDSFSFNPQGIALRVRQGSFKEKCGIHITKLSGAVRLDSTYSNIQLPDMIFRTQDSDIMGNLDLDFNIADEQDPGRMKLRLNAQLGKQDLMNFLGDMPQAFIEHYPNHPLAIKGIVNGNLLKMDFAGLDISLPTAFHLAANGTAGHLADLARLEADLQIEAETQDANFITAMIDPQLMDDYHLPTGLTLKGILKAADTRYHTDITLSDGDGKAQLTGSAIIPLDAKGKMVTPLMTYVADVSINSLNLHHFMPNDSLYILTAEAKAKGYGTDFLSNSSHLTAEATISQLKYGHMNLTDLTAQATLQDGHGQMSLTGHNELLEGTIGADMLLAPEKIEGTVSTDISKVDLYKMRFAEKPLAVGMRGDISIASDLKLTHRVSGLLDNLYIKDRRKTYYPKKVGLLLKTNTDTTYIRAQSGDFIVKLDASGNYERVLRQLSTLGDSVMAQYDQNIIDQPAIKRLLPMMKLHVESKYDNPVATLLKTLDIDFKELLLDIDSSPETGINGTSHLYSLNYDSTRIDTIRLNLTQKGDRLTYQAQICNNKKNPQFVFNALIDGHIHEHGALAGIRYYDKRERLGLRLGATAEMEEEGIRFKLLPQRPTIGYKEYALNEDNFIFLDHRNKIQAKVNLAADDRTGLNIYTENQDSTMLQDITLSLHRIDLDAVTSVLPYMPRITGRLTGDFHILQDTNQKFSVISDMAVADMTYESSPIGNISTEFVYLMKETESEEQTGDTHAIEARLMLDEEEFGLLSGSYRSGEKENHIDAKFNMTRMPLSIANGFVPDQIVGLKGFGEGELSIHGTTAHPDINGEVYVDSAYLVSIPYGVRMRLDSDPIRIVGSHLLLENYGLYANNQEPLNMMGEVDFSDTDRMMVDLRMRARNLQLINSKQEAKSIAYGKAFVNFFARMQGPLDEINMRGRLDVLASTDMSYILLDSPLSNDNRLNELVTFTDFQDSTKVAVVKRPTPSGLNADLTINVSQGAHINCYLNTDQTNYIDIMGGGDLRMKYTPEGLNLTGRYTLTSGEMKYSLPVIPLKTFTIKDGSYVEFTGDPTNPKLNITATEQVKATVSSDGGQTRSSLFDCGIIITKKLNDMGLEFTIDAPEDNEIRGELATMSSEERGKLAVGMLTTGMYLASGNASSFSMNSALSSFLQSEINSIAGSALKTLDLSVGIDNATDATGSMRTDYSFKFSKRFLNNRLKIQIGGKVSTGSMDIQGQTNSFFDNVSMEYRLNQDATKYVTLFFKQNSYDWLDGYTSLYGGGFILRRKLSKLGDIFRSQKNERQPSVRPIQQQPLRRDTVKTDTIKVIRDEKK